MILVFDLDVTLYDEITFVKSGFKAVADFLEQKYGINSSESYQFMLDDLAKSGRGKIFNNILQKHNLENKANITKCLTIYRTHFPNISLSPDAVNCLNRFSGWHKYIVTDGNKVVQHNKIEALGLYSKFNKCFITHRYSKKHSKPSPYCFLKISELEKVDPNEVVYIGDNPKKDFVNIKPLGFNTIRILKGEYQGLEVSKAYDAAYKIKSLDELTEAFISKIAGR
jgi:putative hydrolase of the HAD superfamily